MGINTSSIIIWRRQHLCQQVCLWIHKDVIEVVWWTDTDGMPYKYYIVMNILT